MDLEDPTERAAWREHLGGLVSGRKVMCALAPLAGFVDWVALLREAGARRPLLIATARGAGPVPQPDQADIVLLDVPAAASLTEEVREQDRLLRRLPAHAVRAVEAYDPDGTAVWLTSPFIRADPVLGRAVLAGRPDAWFALEDKLVVDQLWDAVGGVRAPSRVLPLDADPLREASAALDGGEGVVWAGDARDGFNGGGDFVRWVVDDADRSTAQEFFAGRCDRVRVMPFLDGVPCSVHGLVMPDGTAVLRPVELAVLRAGRRFVYGGLGTTWDPPSRDREEMRTLAGRTGERLRDQVGYRGAFGIDGILTRDGFRPTELNTRLSAGIATLGRALEPGILDLLQFNLLAGRDPGTGVEDLERWAVPALDAARFVKGTAACTRRVVTEPWDAAVAWDGERLRRADTPTGWSVSAGPNASGTYCRLSSPPGAVVPVRAGDLNVALLRFLDDELGTGFGDVRAAPDVRRAADRDAPDEQAAMRPA